MIFSKNTEKYHDSIEVAKNICKEEKPSFFKKIQRLFTKNPKSKTQLTNNYVAKSSPKGKIKILDSTTKKCLRKLKGHNRSCQVTSLLLDTREKQLISSSSLGDIKIWDIDKGVCFKTLQAHSSSIQCLVLIPNLNQLVSKDKSGEIKVWCIKTWKCVKMFKNV